METAIEIDKPKLRREWLDALRSGEFEQAGHGLEPYAGAFCCLGIACKVAERHGVNVNHRGRLLDGIILEYQPWVYLAFGFQRVSGDYQDTSLASDNDAGKTFAAIADIIEANADSLFDDDLGIAPPAE